ncbi:hypothetical protein AK812_SmicGene22231 [Symbiodinium microadriaticum]|uniref:Uncharacterized protein n=1 Tax=Symbiodinium microadriaticum TaxID=2951 RepID=A0A1Q9DKD2_SYMMI|nr:hypothetical protein AK812_SmicGene22231 [Symbiodinium microadriaticum]
MDPQPRDSEQAAAGLSVDVPVLRQRHAREGASAMEAKGLETLTLSPFEIHFSQTRIRSEFQDGRPLQLALDEIQVMPNGQGEDFLLVPPFPRIEVTRWRCKLRDSTGAAKLSEGGQELYSQEERWFSFDNRRLCCLQRAAAQHWPKKVCCEVVEIPQTLARTRELRKFDTRNTGLSVLVGRRDDPNPEKWCWRTEVGLPTESEQEIGACGSDRLFMIIYLLMRIAVVLWQKKHKMVPSPHSEQPT